MNDVHHDRETHLWMVPFDALLMDSAGLSGWLSRAEQRRAAAMADPAAGRLFTLTRIALRGILAGHAGVPPTDIELAVESGGRPVIVGGDGWRFSVSHSRHVAVVAVARTDVGVDVEYVRQLRRPARTARRILHPETVAQLEAVPYERRTGVFLDAWTQREAHVKAVGGGLFRTPDALPFIRGGLSDGVFRQVRERDSGEIWNVARFVPDERTRGAVVVRGPTATLLLHDRSATLERIVEVRS